MSNLKNADVETAQTKSTNEVNEPKYNYMQDIDNSPEKRAEILSRISSGNSGSEWVWNLTGEPNGEVIETIEDVIINKNRNNDNLHVIGITSKGKSLITKEVLLSFLDKKDGETQAKFSTQTIDEYMAGVERLQSRDEDTLTDVEKTRIAKGYKGFTPNIGLPVCRGLANQIEPKH